MNSNLRLLACQFFIVIFIGLSVAVGIMLSSTIQKVLKLNELDSEITKLSALNTEFDFYVLNSTLYSDFDDINERLVQISGFNEKVKNKNVLKIIDEKKLSELYTKKHRLAISLISSSASLFNIQAASITLGHKANISPKSSLILSEIIALMNSLYIQKMQDEKSILYIKSLVEKLDIQDEDFRGKIKEKLIYGLNTMINIKSIKDDIAKDQFSVYIDELVKSVDKIFDFEISELYRLSGYLAFCIIILIILTIFLALFVNIANNRNSIILEVFKNLPLELIVFDKKQKPLFVNNRAHERHKLMYENDEVVPYFDFKEHMKNELLSNGIYIDNNYHLERSTRISRLSILKIPQSLNQIKNYFLCKIDITGENAEISRLKNDISKLVNNFNIDKLTGLGSPQALDEKLSRNKTGIIVYITLKHFESMRFYYKATIIDNIIKAFAHSLASYADEYGLAITKNDFDELSDEEKEQKCCLLMQNRLYRLHLDEFCFWVENKKELLKLHGMLSQKFKEPFELVGVEGIIGGISNLEVIYGVSQMTDGATDRLNQAILACYEAQKKDEFFYAYSSELKIEQQYIINQNITQVIKYALSDQHDCHIFLQCQGVHKIKTATNNLPAEQEGEVAYYECLVRMVDESGKIWYPDSFLDIAKKSSLYTKITLKIMELIFDLLERTDAKFSINLSSIDMLDLEIISHFKRYLEQINQKDPNKMQNLCIEILESESVSDYDSIRSFIEMVKNYGCKIAIDDFGSGFSNYYRLLEVDLDYLKIDGSIVKKLPSDKNARTALKSIVDFANNQNYEVVAEFVADEEILGYVRDLGISKVQGWAFSKPRNASDLF